MDKKYLTGFVDIIILASVFVLNSCFSVAHELAMNRKEEIYSSGKLHISEMILKLKAYIGISLFFNILSIVLVVCLFWTVDTLLLYLLIYKVNLLLYFIVSSESIIWNERLE